MLAPPTRTYIFMVLLRIPEQFPHKAIGLPWSAERVSERMYACLMECMT